MIDGYSMDRRALMGRIAWLVGATALPAEAFALTGKKAPKHFLPMPQFATLAAIADTVIPATDTPGAVGVGVPRLIDGMLVSWASASSRIQIAGAIDRIDKLALDGHHKGFAALAPAQRKQLLLPHDREAVQPGPMSKDQVTGPLAGPPVRNPAWLKLKDLIISLYYNSEVAMTREVIYEHVPGQWVPSLKITPGMRPFADFGPF